MCASINRRNFLRATAATAAGVWGVASGASWAARREEGSATTPNVLLIVADDLGFGSLGCYGQTKILTPNLDQLAADGMRFTQFYAGGATSCASLASIFSGHHTGHAAIRDDADQGVGEGQHPVPNAWPNLGLALQSAGHATGLIGRWSLGGGWDGSAIVNPNALPILHGWDHFFGALDRRTAFFHYPTHLWRDGARVAQPGNSSPDTGGDTYAPDAMKNEALQFISDHQTERWALCFTTPLPHPSLQVPDDSLNEYMVDASTSVFDPGDFPYSGFYADQAKPRAAYAAMITRMDRDIGEILRQLDDLGLRDETLVLFVSDNGPSNTGGSDPDFFDSVGGLRGLSPELYEGGLRSPLIARWPGRVAAGATSDLICAAWDLAPTIAEATGATLADDRDGLSLMPTLTGVGSQPEHDFLYWEHRSFGGRQAVRHGRWKAVRHGVLSDPEAPIELYDLETDPAETTNLAAQQPAIIETIKWIIGGARIDSPDFPFPNLPGYEPWRQRAIGKNGWTLHSVSGEDTAQGREAVHAFDGDPDQWWLTDSAPLPHILIIDLGSRHTIDAWVATPRPDSATDGLIRGYELSLADDPADLGVPILSGELPESHDQQIVEFPQAATGRYFQLKVLSEWGDQQTYAALGEVDLLGAEVIVTPPTHKPNPSAANHWERLL